MELIYMIPADAVEDSSNGKFSLLGGGVENIYASTFPAIHPKIAVVVRLRIQEADTQQSHEYRIDVDGPNNFRGTSAAVPNQFQLNQAQIEQKHSSTVGLVINIAPVVFPEPGTYIFHLYIDDKEMGNFAVSVQKIERVVPQQDNTQR